MGGDLLNELKAAQGNSSIIMVAGVGGAGGNALNNMWRVGIQGVNFMVCNTDEVALNNNAVPRKILMGDGLGAGNDATQGRNAAISSLDELRHCLESTGTKMLFITAGMGGGTGTGASPVIAKLAHEMGILTVAIVTSPLKLEGVERYEQAFRGIDELSKYVDSLLVIDNDRIGDMFGRLSLPQAFSKADDVLSSATKGIAEIITVKTALVNVDFADVRKVMTKSGRAHMGVATATGENRAVEVVKQALESPLLDSKSIRGAGDILINIATESLDKLIYDEVLAILHCIQEVASVKDENDRIQSARIIWGASEKPHLGDAIELVIIATRFSDEEDDNPNVMKGIIPPMTVPLQGEVPGSTPTSTLAPATPKSPIVSSIPSISETRPTLGRPSSRYDNIAAMLNTPAYQRRNVQWVVNVQPTSKEVLRDENTPTETQTENSLFDQQ